jgi:hypothetical protein
MFESRVIPEVRSIALLKKAFTGIILALLTGAVSSYRAYYQDRRSSVQWQLADISGCDYPRQLL